MAPTIRALRSIPGWHIHRISVWWGKHRSACEIVPVTNLKLLFFRTGTCASDRNALINIYMDFRSRWIVFLLSLVFIPREPASHYSYPTFRSAFYKLWIRSGSVIRIVYEPNLVIISEVICCQLRVFVSQASVTLPFFLSLFLSLSMVYTDVEDSTHATKKNYKLKALGKHLHAERVNNKSMLGHFYLLYAEFRPLRLIIVYLVC